MSSSVRSHDKTGASEGPLPVVDTDSARILHGQTRAADLTAATASGGCGARPSRGEGWQREYLKGTAASVWGGR